MDASTGFAQDGRKGEKMRLTDADEMLKRAETWNTEDWMDKALYNFMRARIIEQPTVDIDAITESHERIGYDRGFSDGYAQATSEVRHGHWVKSNGDYEWECSSCGYGYTDYKITYCYDCGAKMDEVEE